jgi:hypothetical protein
VAILFLALQNLPEVDWVMGWRFVNELLAQSIDSCALHQVWGQQSTEWALSK